MKPTFDHLDYRILLTVPPMPISPPQVDIQQTLNDIDQQEQIMLEEQVQKNIMNYMLQESSQVDPTTVIIVPEMPPPQYIPTEPDPTWLEKLLKIMPYIPPAAFSS